MYGFEVVIKGEATNRRQVGKMSVVILDEINNLLRNEFNAATTYMHQASVINGMGYPELAKHIWGEALEEMGHAMKLMDRVNLFQRVPSIASIPDVKPFASVTEMLKHQLDLEEDALTGYNRAVTVCRNNGDNGTADLLTEILRDEEVHFDWLMAQIERLKKVGEERYLQKLGEIDLGKEPWLDEDDEDDEDAKEDDD